MAITFSVIFAGRQRGTGIYSGPGLAPADAVRDLESGFRIGHSLAAVPDAPESVTFAGETGDVTVTLAGIGPGYLRLGYPLGPIRMSRDDLDALRRDRPREWEAISQWAHLIAP